MVAEPPSKRTEMSGRTSTQAGPHVQLVLIGEFGLLADGRRVLLPHSAERVLAFLGLNSHPIHRMELAGALWPDAGETHAARSLRTALWRLRRPGIGLARVEGSRVSLDPDIQVDLTLAIRLSRRLIQEPTRQDLDDITMLIDEGDLLPGWDEEWVTADRERYRLLRLEALELAAERLLESSERGRALEAALAAMVSDPLRESARRLVLRIYMSEGNIAAAMRLYGDYRELLAAEVGVEPSLEIERLVPTGRRH
jgi:DNA-binding SARP family transcriptional activator